ncbi:MAG: hypothetical protein MI757_05950 [Pirellulales bacterium]|nr:hypothetical protein [Pirellulales bacterium]
MTIGRRQLLAVATMLAPVACIVVWYAHVEYRKAHFLRDLHLVAVSTSLIGSPSAEQERAARARASELGIDLFAAYENNIETGVRNHLAWLLISDESIDYYDLAKQSIDTVQWPEVRIWIVRQDQESLSPNYRKKLLELILASPTSEAKLFAARWHHKQGNVTESESAYHSAMSSGLFWDALDAADQLLESETYQDAAVDHLLSVVSESEHFTSRAAMSLLILFDAREGLEPLVDSCRDERKGGPNRRLLIDKLTKLVENRVGDSKVKLPRL